MVDRPYNGELFAIEKLPISKIVTPTVYFGNIEGRDGRIFGQEDEREKYEWKFNQEKYQNVKSLLSKYISEHDLEKTSFAVLAFPHVTTIFSATIIDNAQSNMEPSLFNTDDLSPNSGIIKGKNKVSLCGLEAMTIAIETSIWYNSESISDYYKNHREPYAKTFERVFGKMHLGVIDKLK